MAPAWYRVPNRSPEVRRTSASGAEVDIVWSWLVWRLGSEQRSVSVEVSAGYLHTTDLPPEALEAIDTRGASAVDASLGEDVPPLRLVVSSQGVRPFGSGDSASCC